MRLAELESLLISTPWINEKIGIRYEFFALPYSGEGYPLRMECKITSTHTGKTISAPYLLFDRFGFPTLSIGESLLKIQTYGLMDISLITPDNEEIQWLKFGR